MQKAKCGVNILLTEGFHLQDQPLQAVMQEALMKHALGVKYRERNAGYQIDDQMTDQGISNYHTLILSFSAPCVL